MTLLYFRSELGNRAASIGNFQGAGHCDRPLSLSGIGRMAPYFRRQFPEAP